MNIENVNNLEEIEQMIMNFKALDKYKKHTEYAFRNEVEAYERTIGKGQGDIGEA